MKETSGDDQQPLEIPLEMIIYEWDQQPSVRYLPLVIEIVQLVLERREPSGDYKH